MNELQDFLLTTFCDISYGKKERLLIVAIHPEVFDQVKITEEGRYGQYEILVIPRKGNFTWELPSLRTTILFVFSDDIPKDKIWIAETDTITEITNFSNGKETNTMP